MLRVPATDPEADSIERHLARCLGFEVRVGVMLGTRRVNQKPVLQVFDLDGNLRGYAKVGHNDLTAGLVRQEAAALATVGAHEPRSFRIPQRLDHRSWQGLEVLVISALTTDPRAVLTDAARMAAMREIAHLNGTTSETLADSSFWARLSRTAHRLAEEPDGPRLRALLDLTENRCGAAQVSMGGWHGDWGLWNMGMGDGILQIWDWERYDPHVPLGFDGVHLAAQSVRPSGRELESQEASFLRAVPDVLDQLGVRSDQHDLTLRLYLLEIAVRYVAALRHGQTPALRRRTSWVLELLERLPERRTPSPSRGRS